LYNLPFIVLYFQTITSPLYTEESSSEITVEGFEVVF